MREYGNLAILIAKIEAQQKGKGENRYGEPTTFALYYLVEEAGR